VQQLDALMRDHFGQFGNIQDVRVFKDKGFSFIKYVARRALLLILALDITKHVWVTCCVK